jgi:AraC-like DNA-binding protein
VVEGALPPPAGERDAAPCPADRLHGHDKHRIAAVVDGSGVLSTEQEDIAVRRGDILVLAPEVLHRLRPADQGPPPVLVAVEFTPGAVLTPAEQPLVARVFAGRPVVRCSPAAAAEALGLLHRIRAEQRSDKAAGAVAVRAYIMSLLVLLYRRRSRDPGRGYGVEAAEASVREAKAYMEEHYAEPLRVADLAARVHLGVRQFTARFKRAYGETPIRYLTRLRVAAAQHLLCSTRKGVAEIAREVGYENLSHFYRTFVQHAGVPPGRYRQQPPDVLPPRSAGQH